MEFTNLDPLARRRRAKQEERKNREKKPEKTGKKTGWIWSGGSARVGSDSAGAQALNLGEGKPSSRSAT